MRLLVFLCLVSTGLGCANRLTTLFARSAEANLSAEGPTVARTQIVNAQDLEAEVKSYLRRGYIRRGRAFFKGDAGDDFTRQASEQGRAVGASVVVLGEHQKDPAVWGAYFLAKGAPPALGIIPAQLDDQEHRLLETNAGVLVEEVVEASPAFEADILAGDILLSLNGEPITSTADYRRLTAKYAGQQAALHLLRSSRPVDKTVTLRPGS